MAATREQLLINDTPHGFPDFFRDQMFGAFRRNIASSYPNSIPNSWMVMEKPIYKWMSSQTRSIECGFSNLCWFIHVIFGFSLTKTIYFKGTPCMDHISLRPHGWWRPWRPNWQQQSGDDKVVKKGALHGFCWAEKPRKRWEHQIRKHTFGGFECDFSGTTSSLGSLEAIPMRGRCYSLEFRTWHPRNMGLEGYGATVHWKWHFFKVDEASCDMSHGRFNLPRGPAEKSVKDSQKLPCAGWVVSFGGSPWTTGKLNFSL